MRKPASDQNGLTDYPPVYPYLLVARIDMQVRVVHSIQPSLPKARQFLVKLLGHPADRRAGNIPTAHGLQHLAHLARTHPLEIHLRTRYQKRPFTPLPLRKHRGMVGLVATHLGYLELQRPNPRIQRPRLIPVPVSTPPGGPLMRGGRQMRLHFLGHAHLQQMLQHLPRSVGLPENFLQHRPQPFIVLLGHRWSFLS